MQLKISIIVPIYNSEQFLYRCLKSLQAQTYENLEILMIDDGSCDNSASICREFCNEDSRFNYYYQENSGVSTARNRGLDLAVGDYIGFCDSDDWVEADMFETLVSLLEKENADVSVVHHYINDNYIEFEGREFSKKVYNGKDAVLKIHTRQLSTSSLWNKLFRKELFDAVRLDSEITNMEDMLALWELLIKANKVVYYDIPKYHYYVRENSLSSIIKESYWTYRNAVYYMKDKMMRYMPEYISYAQLTIVIVSCWSVEKLIMTSGDVNKYYPVLQKDIITQYTCAVGKLCTWKEKLIIKAFASGKMMSFIFANCLAINRAIKKHIRMIKG